MFSSNHHDWHRGGNPTVAPEGPGCSSRAAWRRPFWRLTPRWAKSPWRSFASRPRSHCLVSVEPICGREPHQSLLRQRAVCWPRIRIKRMASKGTAFTNAGISSAGMRQHSQRRGTFFFLRYRHGVRPVGFYPHNVCMIADDRDTCPAIAAIHFRP